MRLAAVLAVLSQTQCNRDAKKGLLQQIMHVAQHSSRAKYNQLSRAKAGRKPGVISWSKSRADMLLEVSVWVTL